MTTVEPIWTRAETRALGWWAMLLVVATEGTLFATLLASYLYLRFKNVVWPPAGVDKPQVLLPCVATAFLLAAAGAMFLAARALPRARVSAARAGVAAALVCGVAFAMFQFLVVHADWGEFRPSGSAYGSIYYTVVAVLWAHAAAGVLLLGFCLGQLSRGSFRPVRRAALEVGALYTYFVAVAALAVLLTVYLSPQL